MLELISVSLDLSSYQIQRYHKLTINIIYNYTNNQLEEKYIPVATLLNVGA